MRPDARAALTVLTLALLAGCSSQPETPKAPVPLHPGVAEDGRRVFAQCRSCHAIEAGVNRVGPSMHGVVGRTAGTAPGYNYSTAMKTVGLVWTEENLESYLENPRTHVPGTKMSFAGIDDAQQRKDVVAYLATLTD